MCKGYARRLLFIIFLFLIHALLCSSISRVSSALALSKVDFSSEQFRSMQLSDRILTGLYETEQNSPFSPGVFLTVHQVKPDLQMDTSVMARWRQVLMTCNPQDFERVCSAYDAIWADADCFPTEADLAIYENSWMFERNYGGQRGHEGTDLIPPQNLSGYYPVYSMTDGIVEKVGWLPLGGYRIGIRSPCGGYFYYAHLDSYSRPFTPGETVCAGELLGTMGDTGYGPEGTRSKFPVHLHLGIYITPEGQEEISINPYWLLRYIQNFSA